MHARSENTYFSSCQKTENVDCFVAQMVENLEGIKRSVQHKNCSLVSLLGLGEISEIMEQDKNGFMLDKCSLVEVL